MNDSMNFEPKKQIFIDFLRKNNIIEDYICCTETAGYPQRYKAGRYG